MFMNLSVESIFELRVLHYLQNRCSRSKCETVLRDSQQFNIVLQHCKTLSEIYPSEKNYSLGESGITCIPSGYEPLITRSL